MYRLLLIVMMMFVVTGCPLRQTEQEVQPAIPKTIDPQLYIKFLPRMLSETSGLIVYRNMFWTFNDSGGQPIVYGLNRRTGEIIVRVAINNGRNRDWESITQDENYIYIGDIGNNSGARKDLVIYRIAKANIPESGEVYLEADLIKYAYSEQTGFSFRSYQTNFDCEALACLNDSLYLFTKNWLDGNTVVYTLPVTPGDYLAEARDTFSSDGLITGAEFLSDQGLLVLSGYKNFYPFMWVIYGYQVGDLFAGKQYRVNFNEIFRVQTEGITAVSGDSVFISAEATDLPASVYLVKIPPTK
jgi:hypothetical protein